jgi:lipopolysaccharide biosynthesis regulator YciM
VDAAAQAAFSDALLDVLATRDTGQATLLSPEAALCRAGGITAEHFAALEAAPPEQAGALLLLWAQRLYLSELCRVELSSEPQGAKAQLLWARLALGQVRQAQATLPQPLTRATAALLAGKVAQTLRSGWEEAGTVTSSGLPPPPQTGPEMRPAPAPATPRPAPTPAPAPTLPPATASSAPEPPVAATPPATPPPATPAPPAAATGYLEMARKALREGDAKRALDLIAQAQQAGEDQTQALLLRAQAYAALRAPEQQREALMAAIAADKTLYEPRLVLAALERDRGLWQAAAALYREAIAAQPTQAAAYVALSSLYQDQRRPQESLKVLQEGAKTAPDNLSLLYVLAGEYKRRGMLAAAEETYAKLAALAPGAQKAPALQELGRIYVGAGQYAAAFEVLREAAQYAPASQTQRYGELFVACDQAVGQALEAAFQALADLESPTRPAPREQVYQRLTAASAQIQKISDFAAPLKLPEDQQLLLAQRVLYYSLAAEAVTDALVYLDTGDATLKAKALERRQEAAAMPAAWAEPGT